METYCATKGTVFHYVEVLQSVEIIPLLDGTVPVEDLLEFTVMYKTVLRRVYQPRSRRKRKNSA